MSNTDDKEQKFPEGFEHVNDRLNETTQHLKQIDDQIRNIPKEKGPTLEYHPPYFTGRVMPGSRDQTRVALQDRQHEIKIDALAQTEAETRNADGKAGRIVRDQVRESLFPNPYRQISLEDRLNDRYTVKDVEQSQDYMDAELVAKAAERKAISKEPQSKAENKNMDSMSMSARFTQTLSYTKASQKSDVSRSPTRDRELDKERD